MEQKKALAVFIKSFRYFICMVLLLGIAVFACSAVFRDAKVLNTVEVAFDRSGICHAKHKKHLPDALCGRAGSDGAACKWEGAGCIDFPRTLL